MTATASGMRVGKLDAARRQLRTAITLWFNDGDPISVHTLAFAAYEIMHAISEKRDPTRHDLLFDSALIKDEHLRQWNAIIRKHANFFKHADRDGDSVIEFDPTISEFFILYAIVGRELCGESPSDEELAFMWWLQIYSPHLLTEEGRTMVPDRIPINNLAYLRRLSKHEFFEAWREARRQNDKRGIPFGRHTIQLS